MKNCLLWKLPSSFLVNCSQESTKLLRAERWLSTLRCDSGLSVQTSEQVILVFSVNMSGHFQGYAQMTTPIGRRRANVWTEANDGANPWGGSFGVEWHRLYDLPFQKTVHLKNPLNHMKPVKISRDCQVCSLLRV